MKTLHSRKSIGRSLSWRCGFVLVPLALICFALSPTTQAVVPAPDGGYPGGNTAEGQNALFSLTTGGYNTANGWNSLHTLSSGSFNTGIGAATLFANTGDRNTATGGAALFANTTGTQNTATGVQALFSNTTGGYNTANGYLALYSNTTGIDNTASGIVALYSNTVGAQNTATGANALASNINGYENSAFGWGALYSTTTGNDNTVIGREALFNNTTGSANVVVGHDAGYILTTADNVICIGANLRGDNVSNSCFIGNISGADATFGDAVFVTSAGKLGTVNPSSARFKEEVKPMSKASEAILALKPVTFRYKKEFEPMGIPQFGLVAEEVEKVNPDLVKRDRDGKLQTVRYDAVNAMLLNEFLKEHRTVQELKSNAVKQEATIARLEQQIEALTVGLQKVSAQLELTKPAPQTALNNQ